MTRASETFAGKVRSLLGAAALTIILELAPLPAPRPRVSKWGTYYPKSYSVWRKEAEKLLKAQNLEKIARPGFVLVEQVCTKPKTTKREFPKGDVDNYAKGVLDAMQTAGVLTDDDLVLGATCTKRFAEKGETPHSAVTWVYA